MLLDLSRIQGVSTPPLGQLVTYESLIDGNDFKSMLKCNYQREGRDSMDAACQHENKITSDI